MNYWVFIIIIYEIRLSAIRWNTIQEIQTPPTKPFFKHANVAVFLKFIFVHGLTINIIIPLNCDNFCCAWTLFPNCVFPAALHLTAFNELPVLIFLPFFARSPSGPHWNKRPFVSNRRNLIQFLTFYSPWPWIEFIHTMVLHQCIRWEIVHRANTNTWT